jgi:hypothetical protein
MPLQPEFNPNPEDREPMQTQYFERPEGTLAYTDYGDSGDLVLRRFQTFRCYTLRLGKAKYHAHLSGHNDCRILRGLRRLRFWR